MNAIQELQNIFRFSPILIDHCSGSSVFFSFKLSHNHDLKGKLCQAVNMVDAFNFIGFKVPCLLQFFEEIRILYCAENGNRNLVFGPLLFAFGQSQV